jgi:DNA-binding response OmpR family regulator
MAALKILIVDDEIDLVETLKFRLECKGYEVIEAFDGQEGLQRAQNEKPDLLILDVMLPKMDGYHLCRLLKGDEQFKNIPIIMLTARSQESDKKAGYDQGADVYMPKPFEPKMLMEKIEELAGRINK